MNIKKLKMRLLCCMILLPPVVAADDTDIYFAGSDTLLNLGIRPNILFILDTSGSMNGTDATPSITLKAGDITHSEYSSNTGIRRISHMKQAIYDYLDNSENHGQVNVGLMRFNRRGAVVTYPVSPLDAANTHRTNLEQVLGSMRIGSTNTPIVDSLYEAFMYYRGDNVFFGVSRDEQGDPSENHSNRRESRIAHIDSVVAGSGATVYTPSGCGSDLNDSDCENEAWRVGGTELVAGQTTLKYKSPITHSCQSNHVVLLTDGAATWNNSDHNIADFLGYADRETCRDTGDYDERCGEELTGYMSGLIDPVNGTDLIDDATLNGQQNVNTHIIGFNHTDPWLQAMTAKGDGTYNTANNAGQLTSVLQAITNEVIDTSSTLVAPVATVNQFNSLTHRNELYFAVFKPSKTQRWKGNIKKYDLKTVGSEINVIVDKKGQRGINATSGFFENDSVDLFDNIPSPAYTEFNVEDGGVAFKLPASRNVYTYTGTAQKTLSHDDNAVHEDNHASNSGQLSNTDLGAADNTAALSMLKWGRGIDTNDWNNNTDSTDMRNKVGDPLHSKPVVVTYGGTEANPVSSMYVGTNEGYFHAFDASTGVELWSFMPKELLKNIAALKVNDDGDHIYGVDGATRIWINDINDDGDLNDSGDFAYAYFGLRRGGSSYYALDVTDRTSPKFLWSISSADADFSELGQTWATPVKTVVNIDGTPTHVLLISGGYDDDQDADTSGITGERAVDSQGRVIYMVDAQSGSLLWNIDISDDANMKYSIPATLAVADTTQESYANQFYVGDMGGQVWRFDIHNGESLDDDFITGQVIADLSEDSSLIHARRFYSSPDLGIIQSGGVSYMAVTIGSGWRAKPLDALVSDNMYMLRIPLPYDPLTGFTALTQSDLYDATDDVIGDKEDIIENPSSTALQISDAKAAIVVEEAAIATADGWFIEMEQGAGEKVLSKPLILNGEVAWASYEPSFDIDLTTCTPTLGIARGYSVNVQNASRTYDFTDANVNGGNPTRFISLPAGGIVDSVGLINTGDDVSTTTVIEEGGTSLYMGTEKFGEDENRNLIKRSFWYEE